MIKALRDLQAYCEIIVFTYLPRDYMDKILAYLPELKSILSYIICREEMIEAKAEDEFLIKDIGKLLYSRTTEEIIIIETD